MYLQHILQQKAVPTGGKWFFERRMAGHRHKKEVRTCCSTTQTKLLLARRADRREGVWIEVGPESEPHPGCWAGYTASDPDTGAQAASLEMGNCGRCSVASLQKTQHFYTTKRTTWISVDLFWNQICPIFLKVSPSKKQNRTFWGSSGGGRSRFYKMLVHACITTKCILSFSKMLLQNDRESRAKNGLGVRMP